VATLKVISSAFGTLNSGAGNFVVNDKQGWAIRGDSKLILNTAASAHLFQQCVLPPLVVIGLPQSRHGLPGCIAAGDLATSRLTPISVVQVRVFCRQAGSRHRRKTKWKAFAMNCQELAAHLENFQPETTPRDVARLCLLLANTVDNLESLRREDRIAGAWQEATLRLQAASDQHAAMTEELEQLAAMDPRQFTLQEVWVLIRAIKVQSHILQMYVGQPVSEAKNND
jgi:hypothetical protein